MWKRCNFLWEWYDQKGCLLCILAPHKLYLYLYLYLSSLQTGATQFDDWSNIVSVTVNGEELCWNSALGGFDGFYGETTMLKTWLSLLMDLMDMMEEQCWTEQHHITFVRFPSLGTISATNLILVLTLFSLFIFCCKSILRTELKELLCLHFSFLFAQIFMILTFMRAWNKVGRYSNSRMYDSIFFNVL